MLSKSDTSFIDILSTRTITDFCNDVHMTVPMTWPSSNAHYPNYSYFQTFTKDFIDGNRQIFLNFEWINIAKLKIFIELGVSVEMGAAESED